MKNKIFLSLFGVLILTGCNNTCKEDDSYSTVLLPDTVTKYELGIITYIEKEDTYNFKFYNFNMEYKSIEKGTLIDKDGNVIRDGAQIEVGAEDKYVSVCRKHFIDGTTK